MMKIKIGDRLIGEGEPCFIIAEAGINHNGSLEIAKKLVDVACNSGADAVKFQKRNLKHVYQERLLSNPNLAEQAFQYLIPLLREFELSKEDYHELVDYCRQKGILFLCSPWDIDSVDFLDILGVPAYKIASPDMTNFPLLRHVISKRKSIIISTGMSSLEEIVKTVNFLKKRNAEFALLHCNSTYPAPFEEINLRFMEILRQFDVPVGYSGHERGIAVSTVAAALGACVIERHITLDRTMVGPDHAASLEPLGIQKMIRDIRQTTVAKGSKEKVLSQQEILNRELLGKSLIANKDIPKGTLITEELIGSKSPGKGISPQRMEELIGKFSVRDIQKDEFFIEEDFKIQKEPKAYRELAKIIGKWGFVFRLSDIEKIKEVDPEIVELRLSDKDVEEPLPPLEKYRQSLIVHAPEYWYRSLIDLSSLDGEIRNRSLEIMKNVVEKSLKIAEYFEGSPKIVIHPGGSSLEYEGNVEERNEYFEDALQALEEDGVLLLPENMPPRPWHFGGEYFSNSFLDSDEIRDFCTKNNRKICFDLSHAQLYCNSTGKKIQSYIQEILPYIQHIHIADAQGIRGEGIQIDEGEVDFKAIIPLLKSYMESIVPEIWRGHQNNFEGYYTALQRLSKYYH
jgi:N-acetylneuraminate synthase